MPNAYLAQLGQPTVSTLHSLDSPVSVAPPCSSMAARSYGMVKWGKRQKVTETAVQVRDVQVQTSHETPSQHSTASRQAGDQSVVRVQAVTKTTYEYSNDQAGLYPRVLSAPSSDEYTAAQLVECRLARQRVLAFEAGLKCKEALCKPLAEYGREAVVSSMNALPPRLLAELEQTVKALRFDDDIVRKNGLQGPWVRLLDSPTHKKCRRVRMGVPGRRQRQHREACGHPIDIRVSR